MQTGQGNYTLSSASAGFERGTGHSKNKSASLLHSVNRFGDTKDKFTFDGSDGLDKIAEKLHFLT